jgi:hypothetical protein
LWFLDSNRAEIKGNSLETENVGVFIAGVKAFLSSADEVLTEGGRMVLVCGRAKINRKGRVLSVRIGHLCLYALANSPQAGSYVVEKIIIDKLVMKRGSYFAVHAGKSDATNGQKVQRYGEDEILVLRKLKSLPRRPITQVGRKQSWGAATASQGAE